MTLFSNPARLRSRRLALACAGAASLAGAAPLAAQQIDPRPRVIVSNAPETPSQPIQYGKKAFDLFANADFAVAGMRMTGDVAWGLSNNGPITNWTAYHNVVPGSVVTQGAYRQQYIGGINFAAAVPISEYRKIRSIHPGVTAMKAPTGYSSEVYQGLIQGFAQRWGPADRSIGRLFSGTVSTTNKSCTDVSDNASGGIIAGLSLLAHSDCPITWAPTGYDGPRVVTDSAFMFLRDSIGGQGTGGFRFDEFRIPARKRGKEFLGSLSTYGETSDTPSEILASYGSVTPLGSGAPSIPGFPLGLDIRWDAFKFDRPTLSNTLFYVMTVVNNSQRVWGQGINYDSLYMGVTTGFIAGGDNGGSSAYYVPSRNAVFASAGNVSQSTCNGALYFAGMGACGGNGFLRGGVSIVMLKSPIGDERNKLFTTAGSAFYNPSSPFRDDTITFNHGHLSNFGGGWDNTFGSNDRRGFGLMSSTESNVLDGRDPSALTTAQTWVTFRSKNYRGTPGADVAVFNRFVPGLTTQPAAGAKPNQNNPHPGQPFGSWDWNNDQVEDTLYYDNCADQGCTTIWGDTLPGKLGNRGGNVGGVLSAGPFKLKAGDTTQFVFAFVGAPDTTGLYLATDNARQAYKDFFAGPQPFPAPQITSVSVQSAQTRADLGLRPQVTIRFTDTPERYNDPYLVAFAQSLESAADPFYRNLRLLNPTLVDSVRARAYTAGTVFNSVSTPGGTITASGNFAGVYIFKSCDGGGSFDADGDCVGDPALGTNGQAVGLGWQAYAVIDRDATGDIPNSFTDNNVTAGRTYLYSLVSRTRAPKFPVLRPDPSDQSAPCLADVTVCRRIGGSLDISDTLVSSLARSGPTTATVYVPISLLAGGSTSRVTVAPAAGPTGTVPVTAVVSADAKSGAYRIVFGNRFIITQTDSTNGHSYTEVVVQDTVPAASTVDANGNRTTVPGYVRDEQVFRGPNVLTVSGTTFAPVVTASDANRTIRQQTIRASLGALLVNRLTNAPIFLTTDLTPTGVQNEALLARPDFPGFILSFDARRADTLSRRVTIMSSGDSVQTAILNASAVQYQTSLSSKRQAAGTYSFNFKQDAFGPGVPFRLSTVAQLENEFNTSITNRAVAYTAVTDTAISKKILAGTTVYANAPKRTGGYLALIPAKLPFTVTRQIDSASAPVQSIIAVVRRDSSRAISATSPQNNRLLGSAADTARIQVSPTEWLPGDELVVLDVVQRDSVAGGAVVLNQSGAAIQVTDTVVAVGPLVLGCNAPRTTCNPIAFGTPGATGYLPYLDGWKHVIWYPAAFTTASELAVNVFGPTGPSGVLTASQLRDIRVVPNPYLVQSQYDVITPNQGLGVRNAESRILFTGVPEQGVLQIYSVSGQLLNRLSWTAADLQQANANTPGTGDLPYNLRTRENTELASGLYIFVITATGPNGGGKQFRGKFVVIR